MGTSGSTLARTYHQSTGSHGPRLSYRIPADYSTLKVFIKFSIVGRAYTSIAESDILYHERRSPFPVTAGQAIKDDSGAPGLQQRHCLAKIPVSQYEDSACDFSW